MERRVFLYLNGLKIERHIDCPSWQGKFMQVSVETTSGLERRLNISVPASRVNDAVSVKLVEASKTVRLNGFRPGKVPMSVVRQRFGDAVRMAVLNDVMNESFYEAIQQQELKPAGRPEIDPKNIMDSNKDVEFTATFEVFPEVELGDYSKVEVVRRSADVTDADVEKMIGNLRDQRATWDEVERPAATGDKVNLDYKGTKDGEEFAGGSAEGSDLELGSGQMIPGFEDGIVGLSAGDEKTLSLSFPEDYHAEELKGAAVEFAVKVNKVTEKQLAELNDEFYEQFGVKEGGEEAFRAEVKKNMERELANACKSQVKQQVMDGLLAAHDGLLIPAALITQEIDALRQQQVQQFGALAEQLDVKTILPDEMFTEQAERRVRLGLILNALIEKNEIEADADKVRTAIEEIAAGYEDKDMVINHYYSNPQQLQSIEGMVIEDEVVSKILVDSQLTDETSTYDEVVAQSAQAMQ